MFRKYRRMTKEMMIRLDEKIRIYRGSPSVQVTYEDLAQILEDIIVIHKQDNEVGFNGKQEPK